MINENRLLVKGLNIDRENQVYEVYYSENFGDSWQKINIPIISWQLQAINASQNGKIWIISDDTLRSSVDYGATWNYVYKWDFPWPVGDLLLFDLDTLMIADYEGSVTKSVDGGLSWTKFCDLPAQSVTDYSFFDDNNGWCFNHSNIWNTSDGGKTWIKDYTDCTNILSIYQVNQNLSFAFGSNGIILRKKNENVGINVDEIKKKIPISIKLTNNPNPFNPTTKITYTLSKTETVTIEIYDCLGRRIDVILNDIIQSAGEYIVNWNGSEKSSGVYFCQFKAGKETILRKLLLQK